jgi:flotillin
MLTYLCIICLSIIKSRREKELDSKVRKPAEAEKYRLEKIAAAERLRIVLEAEAAAEAKALKVM